MNKSSSNHFFRCATASPQWVETVQNGHVLIMDIGQQTFSHELGSEWVSGASERNVCASKASSLEQMNKLCELTNRRTSKWPSTLRVYSLVILHTVQSLMLKLVKMYEKQSVSCHKDLFHTPLDGSYGLWWRRDFSNLTKKKEAFLFREKSLKGIRYHGITIPFCHGIVSHKRSIKLDMNYSTVF